MKTNISKMLLDNFEYTGNPDLLENYKVAFLCSGRCPSWLILKSYDWAIEQRKKGICIISGFQSKIERDVLGFLAKGNQPIIMVESRTRKVREAEFERSLIKKGQLLIVYPFTEKYKQKGKMTAIKRNEIVCEMADEIVIGYMTERGKLKESLSSIPKDKYNLLENIKNGD